MNEVVIDQTHMNIMNWIAKEDGKKERANDTNTRITHEDEASRISPAVYLDPASREDTPANEKSGIAVNSVSAEVSEEVSESRKPDHSNEEIHEADATLSDEKTWSVCWHVPASVEAVSASVAKWVRSRRQRFKALVCEDLPL